MTDIMNEIYYKLIEQIGQQFRQDDEVKILIRQKNAVIDEIILRLGKGGEELFDAFTDLESKLETIYDQALFQTALCLGTKISLN